MAVKVMSAVWDRSEQKGNKLLLLLAIADNANDDGWAYPSQATLAKKCRVGRRAIQKMLDSLEYDGELVIYNRTAKADSLEHHSNVYHLAKYGEPKSKAPIDLRGILNIRDDSKERPMGRVVSGWTLGSESPDTTLANSDSQELSLESSLNEKTVAPKNSATVSAEKPQPTAPTTEAPKSEPKPRRQNPLYDAIFKVWGYTESMNGAMANMLLGKSTLKGFREFNLKIPITAEQLLEWAQDYRDEHLNGDEKMNMLEDRMKIQSQITRWLMSKQNSAVPSSVRSTSSGMSQEELSKLKARVARAESLGIDVKDLKDD